MLVLLTVVAAFFPYNQVGELSRIDLGTALFFPGAKLPAFALVLLLGLVSFFFYELDLPKLRTPLGAGLAIGLVALLTTWFLAADRGMAFIGIFTFASAGVMFLLGRTTGRVTWMPKALAVVVNVVVTGLVLHALGTAGGLWWFPDAIYGARLASVFQYPNLMGGFALAAFMTLLMTEGHRRWWAHPLLYFSAVGLILSESRGAWLVALGLLACNLLVNWRRSVQWVAVAAIHLGMALVLLAPMRNLVSGVSPRKAENLDRLGPIAGWILGGLVAASLIAILWDWWTARLPEQRQRQATLVALALSGLLVLAVGLSAGGLGRLGTLLNPSADGNITGRAQSLKDGITIFAHHPLGAAWGGWSALYAQYQAYGYQINFAHSSIEQALVDYGLLGLVAFLLIWGGLCWRAVSTQRREAPVDETVAYRNSLLWGVIALAVHSAMDVEFAFGAVVLVLFLMLGVALAGDDAGWGRVAGWGRLGVLLAGALVSYFAVIAGLGYTLHQQAIAARGRGNLDGAMKLHALATSTYSQDATLWAEYAVTLVNRAGSSLNEQDSLQYQRIKQTQVKLAPMAAPGHLDLGYYLVMTHRIDEGIAEFKRATEVSPWEFNGYQRYIMVQLQLYPQLIKPDPARAKKLLVDAREGLRALAEHVSRMPAGSRSGGLYKDNPDFLKLQEEVAKFAGA